jgi:hypothetical protein
MQDQMKLRLNAIVIAFNTHQLSEGKRLLKTVKKSNLSPENAFYYTLVRSALLSKAAPLPPPNFSTFPTALQVNYFLLKASMEATQKKWRNAISDNLIALKLLPNNTLQISLLKTLWQQTLALPEGDLLPLSQDNQDITLQGFCALALIVRQYGNDPQMLLEQINRWQDHFKDHPLNSLIDNKAEDRLEDIKLAKKIGVLLPMSGERSIDSNGIIDGMVQDYYAAKAHGALLPSMVFYDTDKTPAVDLYRQALREGVNVIIGPLGQKETTAILKKEDIDVPTLALSSFEERDETLLYEVSLTPKYIAIEMAQDMVKQGISQVLLIQDSSDNIPSYTFQNAYTALGGKIIDTVSIDDTSTIKSQIAQALHITGSEAREKELEKLLNAPIDFSPRRREDIEAIFLEMSPETASRVVPFLKFYFAGNLPIYLSTVPTTDGTLPTKDFTNVIFPAPYDFQTPLSIILGQDLYGVSTNLPALLALPNVGIRINQTFFTLTAERTIAPFTTLATVRTDGTLYRRDSLQLLTL